MFLSFNLFSAFLPEFFLTFALFSFLFFSFSFQKFTKSINFNDLLIILFFPILFYIVFLLGNQFGLEGVLLNENFVINNLIIWVKIFICFLLMAFLAISLNFFKFERFQLFEFIFLILFSILGMFLVIMANNFFVFYMSLELQSFCFYILAAMRRYSNLSVEAALKYFILWAFSSSVFLFGSSLIYGSLGTLNFMDIELVLSSFNSFLNFNKLVFFGAFFILVGFFFKLGIVPFHFWIADVYEGSPLLITAFFSVFPKISFFFVLLIVIFFVFSSLSYILIDVFYFSALSSVFLGILYALYQYKIKRLLAYSAVTHMGYILFAISQGSVEGFQSFFIYIFIYVFSSLNIFGILLAFRQHKTFYKLRKIVDFSYLLRSNFVLTVMLSFIIFRRDSSFSRFF